MGVLPLTFEPGTSWKDLGLTGSEIVTIKGLTALEPRKMLEIEIAGAGGAVRKIPVLCRIDTVDELDYFKNGGILPYVLRRLAAA